jgi:uncharacterized glyoxalase superfamily protein PhnB
MEKGSLLLGLRRGGWHARHSPCVQSAQYRQQRYRGFDSFLSAAWGRAPRAEYLATDTGIHHANAVSADASGALHLDLDSVAFARLWNDGWRNRSNLEGRVVVGFGVGARENVDRLHGDMTAAGYRSLQVPYDAFWGARYAVIEDPDGIAVGLMSDISADRKSSPPDV